MQASLTKEEIKICDLNFNFKMFINGVVGLILCLTSFKALGNLSHKIPVTGNQKIPKIELRAVLTLTPEPYCPNVQP